MLKIIWLESLVIECYSLDSTDSYRLSVASLSRIYLGFLSYYVCVNYLELISTSKNISVWDCFFLTLSLFWRTCEFIVGNSIILLFLTESK